jgi:hypothetical protein
MAAARANTTAAMVDRMAIPGWRNSGGLHSAPAAEPTSRQMTATSTPAASTRKEPGRSVSTSKITPTAASTTPPPSATSSVASWARIGPRAAATQARAASGSAVSMDLVRMATAGTRIAALQVRPEARDEDPVTATSTAYKITGMIHRCERNRIADW